MEGVDIGMWAWILFLVTNVIAQSYSDRGDQRSYSSFTMDQRREQCPLACRCSRVRPGHELLRRWQGLKSPSDVRMLENAIEQGHRFRRDFSSGSGRGISGRDMMCMGLRELPSSIPSDVIRLSVFGEEVTLNQSSGPISYDQSRKPSSITARQSALQLSNQLSTIRKSAFMRSRDLLELSIVGNDVRYIAPAEFEYLPNLVLLNLKGNNLKSLEPQTFRGLYHLEELRLSQNNLYSLPSELLDDVPRLKKLYLDKNQIRSLHGDIFHSLRNLEILDLSWNNLTYLPRTVFAKNRHLRELYVDDNTLDGVKSDWFSHALQLQKLSMNRNRISMLDPGSLTVIRMLSELSLSGNQITRIHSRTLSAFHNLRKLDLSDNRIGSIPAETFQRTSKLAELNLSKNKLIIISQDVFGRTSDLKILDLSDNMIDVVTRENFKKLNNLQKLDLSGNRIKDLMNGTFLGLRKLRELNLARNKILAVADSSFSVSLSRFVSQLTWLNLQRNKITSVSQMSFRTVPHLKFLNLAFNKILSIHEKAFESQRQLNTLLLNNNLFGSLPGGVFFALKNVRHLNIGYNQLRDLPSSVLKGLTRLDELNAQGNRLTYLLNTSFQEIPTLVRANFSGNSIQYVDLQNLSPSITLNHLDLSRNNLSDVKVSQSFGIRLKFLSLAHNHLTTLHSDISNSMATGGKLALQDNPWYCDCHLSWLQYLVPIWQLRLLNPDLLICGQPRELSGNRILSLRQSEFTCGSASVNSGSPAIRSPVRERHNYHPREHRTTFKTEYPERRRNYFVTTATPTNAFYPKQRTNPRSKNRFNSIPYITPTPASPKLVDTPNVERKASSHTDRTSLINQLRPIPPRPNLVIGHQKDSKRRGGSRDTAQKSASTVTAAPNLQPRYPWWRNYTYTSTQNLSPTFNPPFRANQWWRNHLYRSRQTTQTPRLIVQPTQWRNNTFRPIQNLQTPKPTSWANKWRINHMIKQTQNTQTPRPKIRANHHYQDIIPQRPFPHRSLQTPKPTTRSHSTNWRSRNSHHTVSISGVRWWNPNSPYYTTASPTAKLAPTRQTYTNRPPYGLTKSPNKNQRSRNTVRSWFNKATNPPPRDTTRRKGHGPPFVTSKPVRNPYHMRGHSHTTKAPINRGVTNRSHQRIKPTIQPYPNLRKSTRRPFVLTLPTTLKPKLTIRPYLPNSHPKKFSPMTTVSPARATTHRRPAKKKTHQQRILIEQDTIPLGCPLQSEWRLHFDKTLIRRHKAEVKNFHVTVLNTRRQPACNAVLLSDWWVLTSASCVERHLANSAKLRNPSWSPNYHVKIGLRELNKVTGIVVHPLYLSRRSEEHDFALLKLKYDSLMTKVFTPPCLMPPEWFRGRAAWVVPGVVSARFDSKKPRSNLQTLAVKVWETNCERNPVSCLRIQDKKLNTKSVFTDGAPLYLGYSETRWSLIGLGRSSAAPSDPNKYLPVWTVLNWLKNVVSS